MKRVLCWFTDHEWDVREWALNDVDASKPVRIEKHCLRCGAGIEFIIRIKAAVPVAKGEAEQ